MPFSLKHTTSIFKPTEKLTVYYNEGLPGVRAAATSVHALSMHKVKFTHINIFLLNCLKERCRLSTCIPKNKNILYLTTVLHLRK